MVNKIYENDSFEYLHFRKELIKINKKNKEETILFETESSLRLVKILGDKAIFFIRDWGDILLFDFNSEKVFEKNVKGDILKLRISTNYEKMIILTDSPSRIILLDLKNKLKIISNRNFKELKLKNLRMYTPRIDFEVIDSLGIVILTHRYFINIYDLNLKRLIRLTHSYPKTFLTATESYNQTFTKLFEQAFENVSDSLGRGIYDFEFSPITKEDTNKALKFFSIKENFKEDELKQKFRLLLKKYHPDVNKSKDANEKTLKTIEFYSLLKFIKMKKPIKLRVSKSKKENDNTDWFSFVKLIKNRIYFGTYSGRVFGLDYKKLKFLFKTIKKGEDNKDLLVTDIMFFQNFYFKSPIDDINVVFDVCGENGKIIIETSSNPFVRKELKNSMREHKKYTINKEVKNQINTKIMQLK